MFEVIDILGHYSAAGKSNAYYFILIIERRYQKGPTFQHKQTPHTPIPEDH